MTIKLYRNIECQGLLSGTSPYAAKLEIWLKMADIPHEVVIVTAMEAVENGPRGLMPYIDLDDERIGDTSLIIERLNELHRDPLNDQRLTERQVSIGDLVKSMCETEMFWITVYGRFADDDCDWRSIAHFNYGEIPEEQLEEVLTAARQFALHRLDGSKLGRYDSEFVIKDLRRCLKALSHTLGDQPFLFGDNPSVYDATLFGAVSQFVHYPYRTSHVGVAREYTNLVDYCDRLRATYFDYEPKAGEL